MSTGLELSRVPTHLNSWRWALPYTGRGHDREFVEEGTLNTVMDCLAALTYVAVDSSKKLWLFMIRRTCDVTLLTGVSNVAGRGNFIKSVYEPPPLVGCSSPFMRLARHLTALRPWCKQCLPGR